MVGPDAAERTMVDPAHTALLRQSSVQRTHTLVAAAKAFATYSGESYPLAA
jgi:hypothetical protein